MAIHNIIQITIWPSKGKFLCSDSLYLAILNSKSAGTTWYSLPFVSPDNLLVTYISSIGAVLEATYELIFLIVSPKKEKAKFCGCLFEVPNGIGTLLGAVQLILYAIYRDNREEVKKDEMNESVEMRTGELQDKKLANTKRHENGDP
ncbi:bidirectional sugar transporter SWEET1b-like [Solanum dulcamara]|uniref:bidirectional sugar transporter SWEET1b-like n=1 Tax=Solanum dulcamara TaxID=45834 RepID=UPI002485A460|nr:bidirectional sugar transporter SWEET1b-like [Solanum dulcamara]